MSSTIFLVDFNILGAPNLLFFGRPIPLSKCMKFIGLNVVSVVLSVMMSFSVVFSVMMSYSSAEVMTFNARAADDIQSEEGEHDDDDVRVVDVEPLAGADIGT